jgi:bacillaene synthase trans-acting acyltransferase
MFSGQGSQYYHMGRELYIANTTFKHWMSKINRIIQRNAGISILDEMYNTAINRSAIFDKLLYTHPAIFMVEYSLMQVCIESGIEPDYVLGASLGEFTAAAIAGILSLEEVLECLLVQSELIESYCQKGTMIAIVHNPELYRQTSAIHDHSELAAINYSSHFIISGNRDQFVVMEDSLKSKEILFQTLPVRYGFHSANIEPIRSEYKKKLSNFIFKNPEIPVISCLSAGSIENICPEHFWNVLRQPIHFQKTIQRLEADNQFIYIDLGPSGTLANFVKRNLGPDSISEVYNVLTPFGQDVRKLQRVIECLS